jgi:hypothetical protein
MKLTMRFAVILALMIQSGFVSFSGTVARWSFTEMAGTTLLDRSGNGNNGQIVGAVWQQPSGLRSLLFNGSSNYVAVPHNSAFDFGTGDFTIEIQFKISVIPAGSWVALISKHNTATWHDREFNVCITGSTGTNPGRPFVQISDGTGYSENAIGTASVCDGMFHTIRGMRENGQLKIYVDGVLQGTTPSSINVNNSNPVNIGRSSYANGYGYFNGTISSVSVWNQAIPEERARWSFTEMTGTVLLDRSGNGNNGQIIGAVWQQPSGLRSLLFNGSSNYVAVPHNSAFNFGTGDFTIEIQFKISVIPAGSWAALISKHNTATWHDREFNVCIDGSTGTNPGRPFVQISDGTGYSENAIGTASVCDGMFHTIRGMRENGQLKIYVDGVLQGTTPSSISVNNSNPVNIGRSSYDNGYGYFNGTISSVSVWSVAAPTRVDEDPISSIVQDYRLWESYPNPFNPSTTIQYDLPKAGYVSLKVFDCLGKEVASLTSEEKEAGRHSVQFEAQNLPSGVYFYRLQAGTFVETKRLLLLR